MRLHPVRRRPRPVDTTRIERLPDDRAGATHVLAVRNETGEGNPLRFLLAGSAVAVLTLAAGGAQGTLRENGSVSSLEAASTYQSQNVRLLSHFPLSIFPGTAKVSDCWGYVSPSGREYALVGLDNGTAFVEVTDPGNPSIVVLGSGPQHPLRDIKVFGDIAYSGNKIRVQIYGMTNIDAGVVTDLGLVSSGGIIGVHNLAVDEASGFLYACDDGASLRGIRAYDLNPDPTTPTFVGEFQSIRVHDAQVVTYSTGPYAGRQIAFCCGPDSNGNNHGMRILDVTDKSNMFIRRQVFWPNAVFAHQGWLSEDRQYFYANDELDEKLAGLPTTTYVIDVSDLDTAFLASTFDNGNAAIGHNLYVAGDRLFESNFASGLRVFDLSVDPLNPPEVGWFDTCSLDDLPNVTSQFSNYPFFPSGIVLGSDLQEGMFVWWAGDPLVDIQLASAKPATLPPTGASLVITMAELTPGDLVPGTEALHYSTGGPWQEVPLANMGGGTYAANFPALPCPALVSYYLCADSPNGVE